MASVGLTVCKQCTSVCFEAMDGMEFYASYCPFCGKSYSRETIVDDDYYIAMGNRQIAEFKDSYENIVDSEDGRGVAYFAAKGEKIESKYLKEHDRVDIHITSWDAFHKGVILRRENEGKNWYEEMVNEIETNLDIDKDRSYVTQWNQENELILLYGDKLRFTKGSNYEVKKKLDEIHRVIDSIEYAYNCKKDETIKEIEKKISRIKEAVETEIGKELVEIYKIIETSEDDEDKVKERENRYSGYKDIPF